VLQLTFRYTDDGVLTLIASVVPALNDELPFVTRMIVLPSLNDILRFVRLRRRAEGAETEQGRDKSQEENQRAFSGHFAGSFHSRNVWYALQLRQV